MHETLQLGNMTTHTMRQYDVLSFCHTSYTVLAITVISLGVLAIEGNVDHFWMNLMKYLDLSGIKFARLAKTDISV